MTSKFMPTLGIFLLMVLTVNSCMPQQNQPQDFISIHGENLRLPKSIGYVNDYASLLDSIQVFSLEKKLENYDKQTTNQIAIAIFNSDELTEENFDAYALALSNYWGVGTKEFDNGLTIVMSTKLGRIRVNTGLGTEKILTDEICEKVLENIIIPEFRNKNYYVGLDKATDELIRIWNRPIRSSDHSN